MKEVKVICANCGRELTTDNLESHISKHKLERTFLKKDEILFISNVTV